MSVSARLPLIQEIDLGMSPPEAFRRFLADPSPFFLDGGMDHHKLGRYSFIGSDPFLLLCSRGRRNTVTCGGDTVCRDGNPFDVLGELLDRYRQAPANSPVPFTGGAVGYLGYDLCHFVERLPSTAVDDLDLPECRFGFYDVVLAFDNLQGTAYLVSTGLPEEGRAARLERAGVRLEETKRKLAGVSSCPNEPFSGPASEGALSGGFTHEEYVAAVERARQYIIAGDIFEVNLSQRFWAALDIPPYELYRRLRRINPAPFASYLDFGDMAVAGASPERFLRLQGDRVETRPIKGTRSRGRTPEEDEALARELLDSPKDRAENVMIVDLERNDLGRVCRYGTVKVAELAALEVFPTVFHLTSTVVGRLRRGESRIDLLKATFPGGSITGAPKVRAMEIIDELEPTRRGVYTGSIGYMGFDGAMDLNIVIRTFVVKDGRAYFQVGGAVVYDSDPELEYQETLHKARALMEALDAPGAEPS